MKSKILQRTIFILISKNRIMKRISIITLFLLTSFILNAQETPIKIVFDVTSSDIKIHQSTLRHVNLMSKSYPDSQFEVVVYSGALDMLVKDKSSVSAEVEKFADNDKVAFVVCAMSMKRHKVDKSELIAGVEPVPDGILEIYQKQSEGWGYIKEAN